MVQSPTSLQRGFTLPQRKVSLYIPPQLPVGHLPPRRDPPRRRHAAPTGPWPFVDVDDKVDPEQLDDSQEHYKQLVSSPCSHQLSQPFGSQDAITANEHLSHATSTSCWCKYPQSLYPNWTERQQEKSRILDVSKRHHPCPIYYLDMKKNGLFVTRPSREVRTSNVEEIWELIKRGRPSDVHLRMLFVDNSSGYVMQMLGTRYNIEPFYFSSTIGWIPTRFQSNIVPHESDHITVVFTFMRTIENPSTNIRSSSKAPSRAQTAPSSPTRGDDDEKPHSIWPKEKDNDQETEKMMIDTQKPLPLRSNNQLLILDRLALHMIRCRPSSSSSGKRTPGNTIISLHPTPEHMATTAKTMHSRVALTGRSVYWANLFRTGRKNQEDKNQSEITIVDRTDEVEEETRDDEQGNDPTFVFLSFLWYAAYAWDESLQVLYSHISTLEMQVIQQNDLEMTNELHVIQAHLLHFENLLEDFKKTIEFVRDTPNPAMEKVVAEHDPLREREDNERRLHIQELMHRESQNLLSEVGRLERQRKMMEKRLRNVMNLGFALINIEDSKQTRILTEASLRDGAAMKQIAYLTMVFLPSTFVATAFGMNITDLTQDGAGTLAHYLEATLPLTALTVWIVIGYQLRLKDVPFRITPIDEFHDEVEMSNGNMKVVEPNGDLTEAVIGNSHGASGSPYGTSRPGSAVGVAPRRSLFQGGLFDSTTDGQHIRFKELTLWERVLWPITLMRWWWYTREIERLQKARVPQDSLIMKVFRNKGRTEVNPSHA